MASFMKPGVSAASAPGQNFSGYGRNAGKRWRPSDIQELRALVRRGAELRVISLKLGRPHAAIRAKAQALHLPVPRAEDEPAVARTSSPAPAPATPARALPRPSGSPQLELFA